MKYRYMPGIIEILDPVIISGGEIAQNAIVEPCRTNVDPCNKFVYVKDEQGNVNSVYKTSLRPIARRVTT